MTPGALNLTFTAGDGYSQAITFQDENGNALDQSAYTFRAQLRPSPASDTKVDFTITQESEVVTVSLTSAQTRMAAGTYVWDLERAIGTGDPETILSGTVRVLSDVTRSEA